MHAATYGNDVTANTTNKYDDNAMEKKSPRTILNKLLYFS